MHLNNIELPQMPPDILIKKDVIWYNLRNFYQGIKHPKRYKYQLVIDVICEMLGYIISDLIYTLKRILKRGFLYSKNFRKVFPKVVFNMID